MATPNRFQNFDDTKKVTATSNRFNDFSMPSTSNLIKDTILGLPQAVVDVATHPSKLLDPYKLVFPGVFERAQAVKESIQQKSLEPLKQSFTTQTKEMFVQPGDSPEVIANKAMNFGWGLIGAAPEDISANLAKNAAADFAKQEAYRKATELQGKTLAGKVEPTITKAVVPVTPSAPVKVSPTIVSDTVNMLKTIEQLHPDITTKNQANSAAYELSKTAPMDQPAIAQSIQQAFQPQYEAIQPVKPKQDILFNEKPPEGIQPSLEKSLSPEMKPITPIEPTTLGPGYNAYVKQLEDLVKTGTMHPEDVNLLKEVFKNTNDDWLKSITVKAHGGLKRSGNASPSEGLIKMRKYLTNLSGKTPSKDNFWQRADLEPASVLLHEYGHLAHAKILNAEEKQIVRDVFNSLSRSERRKIFTGGLSEIEKGGGAYFAKNEGEFLVQSFAEYVMENKVPTEKMRPLLERLFQNFMEAIKRLVTRGKNAAIERLKPIFEKMLSGDKNSPLSRYMETQPVSYREDIAKLLNELPKITKEVPIKTLLPKITETPIDVMQKYFEEAKQNLPPDIEIDTPQQVLEKDKRTPLNQRVNMLDYLRTPWRVFEKMGIRPNYQDLMKGYDSYLNELPKNIDKITAWSKEVSPESNERIFRSLDGEPIQLNPQEAKIAGEIKTWLSEWADRLGMKPDERITDYITHLFPFGKAGEIPEEISSVINKRIPGSVFDPFLLQRQGVEGYIKDTWKALDAYVKRATRKVNMDPALANLKEATAKLTETSQLDYINSYVSKINLRPSSLDTLIDNGIKQVFGFKFGVRPTAGITRGIRQMIARAKIGGSITSLAKNLTQGVNTFSELGARYTTRGYMDLIKFGRKELEENNVLLTHFIEDQTYSAIKKWAERADRALFANMNATELINRGAAYFGGKAKFLDGNVTPKEYREAFGKPMPDGYKPTLEDAKEYGKSVAAKTQFLFGSIDTPVFLSSDIAKTAGQFQTYGLKQQEFILEHIHHKDWAKFARYLIGSALLFQYIGGAFGMTWKDTFPYFKFGYPPFLQFAMDVGGAVLGTKDQYGNVPSVPSRLRTIGSSLFTNVVPGGAQLKRSFEGIQAVNQGASRTATGNWQYPVAQTPMNYIRATLFGKSNLPEAQAYYNKKPAAATKTNRFNQY